MLEVSGWKPAKTAELRFAGTASCRDEYRNKEIPLVTEKENI